LKLCNKKLNYLYEIFSDAVKLIEEMGIKKEKNMELISLYNRMKYLRECFKIFLDEYEKMSEIVMERIKEIGSKYDITGEMK